MDLTALGGERFADALLAELPRGRRRLGADALVAFFAVHRALVRAKVLLVRAGQHPPGSAEHGHAEAQARELIGLAERFAWRARLPLAIVVCGVPASGKSTLAAALAERAGLPRISSDLVRKRLAGVAPTRARRPRCTTRDQSGHVRRARSTERATPSNGTAEPIVDATFRRRADRQAFADAFDEAAPVVFVRVRRAGGRPAPARRRA